MPEIQTQEPDAITAEDWQKAGEEYRNSRPCPRCEGRGEVRYGLGFRKCELCGPKQVASDLVPDDDSTLPFGVLLTADQSSAKPGEMSEEWFAQQLKAAGKTRITSLPRLANLTPYEVLVRSEKPSFAVQREDNGHTVSLWGTSAEARRAAAEYAKGIPNVAFIVVEIIARFCFAPPSTGQMEITEYDQIAGLTEVDSHP